MSRGVVWWPTWHAFSTLGMLMVTSQHTNIHTSGPLASEWTSMSMVPKSSLTDSATSCMICNTTITTHANFAGTHLQNWKGLTHFMKWLSFKDILKLLILPKLISAHRTKFYNPWKQSKMNSVTSLIWDNSPQIQVTPNLELRQKIAKSRQNRNKKLGITCKPPNAYFNFWSTGSSIYEIKYKNWSTKAECWNLANIYDLCLHIQLKILCRVGDRGNKINSCLVICFSQCSPVNWAKGICI